MVLSSQLKQLPENHLIIGQEGIRRECVPLYKAWNIVIRLIWFDLINSFMRVRCHVAQQHQCCETVLFLTLEIRVQINRKFNRLFLVLCLSRPKISWKFINRF